jgi:hypothetical protein
VTDPKQRKMIGLVIGFCVLTLYMCLQSGIAGIQAMTLSTSGVTTEAVVVGADRAGKKKSVIVDFDHQGRTVTADCNSCSSELDISDRVLIRYDPARLASDVEDARNSGSRNLAVASLIIMLVSLAAAGFTGRRLLNERRRSKAGLT